MSGARVDLDMLLLAPWVVADWIAHARQGAAKARKLGIKPSEIPDEEAEIMKDGSLRMFVQVGEHVLLERTYPPGSWAWKEDAKH